MGTKLLFWIKSKERHPRHTKSTSIWRLVKLGFRVIISKYYLLSCTCTGKWPRVWGKPRVDNSGSLIIGHRVRLRSTIVPIELVARPGASLVLGDRVYINYGASICAHRSIYIGAECIIGTYAIIIDNDEHDLWHRHELPPSEPVTLEENVWIGDRVTILKGVRIGRNSVVGAGSVVTRSIPSNSVAAGVPARVLKALPQSSSAGAS